MNRDDLVERVRSDVMLAQYYGIDADSPGEKSGHYWPQLHCLGSEAWYLAHDAATGSTVARINLIPARAHISRDAWQDAFGRTPEAMADTIRLQFPGTHEIYATPKTGYVEGKPRQAVAVEFTQYEFVFYRLVSALIPWLSPAMHTA